MTAGGRVCPNTPPPLKFYTVKTTKKAPTLPGTQKLSLESPFEKYLDPRKSKLSTQVYQYNVLGVLSQPVPLCIFLYVNIPLM